METRLITIEIRDSHNDLEELDKLIENNNFQRFKVIDSDSMDYLECLIEGKDSNRILNMFSIRDMLDNIKWRV